MGRMSFLRRALCRGALVPGAALAAAGLLLVAVCEPALAVPATGSTPVVSVFGIPVDFILFALTLLGVALFHHHTLPVALTGLAAIIAYKLAFAAFPPGPGLAGLATHMQHEAVILSNLFLLLMGFALLSRHFEEASCPTSCRTIFRRTGRVHSRCSSSSLCFRASSITSLPRSSGV
jgi:hypothetical protein